jgi:hypothetical protein
VVVEPRSETVTHIVVREREFAHQERLVPLARVCPTCCGRWASRNRDP